jgi:hypothetical protein
MYGLQIRFHATPTAPKTASGYSLYASKVAMVESSICCNEKVEGRMKLGRFCPHPDPTYAATGCTELDQATVTKNLSRSSPLQPFYTWLDHVAN